MVYKINEVFYDRLFVMDSSGDGVTGLVNANFTKTLHKSGSVTTETITVTEQSSGYYYITFTPESTGTYSYLITNATYQPEGWYNDILVRSYSNDDIKAETSTVATNVLRALGLMQENIYLDTQVYDASSNLTSARMRTYSTSGDVGTDTNILATYTITATYTGTDLTTYKVVKS